ncbi:MAG: hypothetical protein ACREBB_00450 [Nitrosotalea sp.]
MHDSIDLYVYFEVIIYPVVAIFIIEMISRAAKIPNWIKLLTQAISCIGFGVAYLVMHVAHWLTAFVLLALAIALLYQAKVSKLNPQKALY